MNIYGYDIDKQDLPTVLTKPKYSLFFIISILVILIFEIVISFSVNCLIVNSYHFIFLVLIDILVGVTISLFLTRNDLKGTVIKITKIRQKHDKHFSELSGLGIYKRLWYLSGSGYKLITFCCLVLLLLQVLIYTVKLPIQISEYGYEYEIARYGRVLQTFLFSLILGLEIRYFIFTKKYQ
ncbi:MAG: hypothetical protein PHE88_05645 [Elusimicrobia bacterium]|nr:hypothetical protein [Elusimicrobiota bacterium]